MTIHIHSIATAVPPHEMPQPEVEAKARQSLGLRNAHFERLSRTFQSAGVERRYSVVPLDWFDSEHGWAGRNAAYLEGAKALFLDAASRALAEAGWRADNVDCVVTLSSTGIATPTLEAQALSEIGFREDIQRVPVFGLGCAGGVSGLTVAQSMAEARPGSRVLFVVVEACTLSYRTDRMQKADIIAAVLFGDGAAAACLSTAPAGQGPAVTLGRASQQTWPGTLGIMGWDVDDTGLGVVFDRSIPDFVSEAFAGAVATALETAGLDRAGIDRFVCHPGGAKVLEAIERVLHLEQGVLEDEREVLRRFGNMSAPTVLFVLQSVLRSGRSGQMLACALGPGFSAAFLPVHVAEAARDAA